MENMKRKVNEMKKNYISIKIFIAILLILLVAGGILIAQRIFFKYDNNIIISCVIEIDAVHEPLPQRLYLKNYKMEINTQGEYTVSLVSDWSFTPNRIFDSMEITLEQEELEYISSLAKKAYFEYQNFEHGSSHRGSNMVNVLLKINDKSCDFGMDDRYYERFPIFEELMNFLLEHTPMPLDIKKTNEGYYMGT